MLHYTKVDTSRKVTPQRNRCAFSSDQQYKPQWSWEVPALIVLNKHKLYLLLPLTTANSYTTPITCQALPHPIPPLLTHLPSFPTALIPHTPMFVFSAAWSWWFRGQEKYTDVGPGQKRPVCSWRHSHDRGHQGDLLGQTLDLGWPMGSSGQKHVL